MSDLPANSINSIISSEKLEEKTVSLKEEANKGPIQSIVINTPVQSTVIEPITIKTLADPSTEQNNSDPIPQITTKKEMDSITSLANSEEQDVREKIAAAHNGSQ